MRRRSGGDGGRDLAQQLLPPREGYGLVELGLEDLARAPPHPVAKLGLDCQIENCLRQRRTISDRNRPAAFVMRDEPREFAVLVADKKCGPAGRGDAVEFAGYDQPLESGP